MGSRNRLRWGFTLVEMLVAVTLVLLMMSMFAQIFQIAGGSITKQRGIAENDQRTRTFQNVMKADLDKRTFRIVMPWAAGEDGAQAEAEGSDRSGYLYISENDPNSGLDDFFQFTTNTYILTKNKSTDPYFGKATQLGAGLTSHPNQPEADDARPDANGTGQSAAAEVAYFLRGSNLYRRVLLLREPLDLANATAQPTFATSTLRDAFDWNDSGASGEPLPYPQTGGMSGSSTFWNDFDYSAHYGWLNSDNTKYGARFHGLEDLNNASTSTQFHLGKPQYRFGFNPATAHSREWSTNGFFLGRYTHEETSHPNFHYPQALAYFNSQSGSFDPTNPNTVVNVDTTPAALPYRIVQDFSTGPRRGEDLILANVHMFDIKVWDGNANGGLGAFVDIGNDGSSSVTMNGDFTAARNFHRNNGIAYGSDLNTSSDADSDGNGNENRVFDSWHADVRDNLFGGTGANRVAPPYRPVQQTPSQLLTGPPASYPSYQAYESWGAYESGSSRYSVGSRVFPQWQDVGPPPGPRFNKHAAFESLRFTYVCIAADAAASTPNGVLNHGTSPPAWPRVAGGRVQDGDLTWEAVENWKPLRALQITVRFLDVTSNQMRQTTLVHSLID